jgi:hypothetical protein
MRLGRACEGVCMTPIRVIVRGLLQYRHCCQFRVFLLINL